MILKKQKLAIHLFGFLRTYRLTKDLFLENILNINKSDWDIDIFIHTWDSFEAQGGNTWHNHNKNLDNKFLQQKDIDEFVDIYKPKKYAVETLTISHGMALSIKRVNELRIEYENQYNIKYDYYLYTRFDILFIEQLIISLYIQAYKKELYANKITFENSKKLCFAGNNIFGHAPIMSDIGVYEWELIWFCNYSFEYPNNLYWREFESILIPIDYRLHREFFIQRSNALMQHTASMDALSSNINEELEIRKIKLCIEYKIGEALLFNTNGISDYIKLIFILRYFKRCNRRYEKLKFSTYWRLCPNINLIKLSKSLQIDFIYNVGSIYMQESKKGLRQTCIFLFKTLPNLKKEASLMTCSM